MTKIENDKNINEANDSVDLEQPFKTVITHYCDINHDEAKKSFLKKLASIPAAGILLAAMSSICFATGSLCCRLLSDEVNSNQVVISRSLLQLIVYSVVNYFKNSSVFGLQGERLPLFFRAFFGAVALVSNYMAIQMIGLSDASAIVFSAPVFCVFFCLFLIGEPFRCSNLITLIMVMFGIILICKPEILIEHRKVQVIEDTDRLLGSLIAFISCLSNAMVFIALRKLQKTSSQISIISSVLMNVFLFGFNLPKTHLGWFLLLVNSLCGVFGQLLLTLSLKIAEAGAVSMTRTLDIVMSFIYQVTILHQSVEFYTVIGAILICLGVVITSAGVSLCKKIKNCFVENQQRS